MRIKNQTDFWAGIMFIAFGFFFVGFGITYSMGTPNRIGPGVFPTGLGTIVILLGIILSIGSLTTTGDKVAKFPLSTLLLVLGPVALFGVLLKTLGLVLSLLILVAISSYASQEFSWKGTLINAAALITICLTIFVWLLKLNFQLWPSLIGK